MKLFIDDERTAPVGYDRLARTVEAAIYAMQQAKESGEPFELVSLDYDAHRYLNITFVEAVQWMKDNDFWPAEVRIHTANVWDGRPFYLKFLANHGPKEMVVDQFDPHDMETIMKDRDSVPPWVFEFLEANH